MREKLDNMSAPCRVGIINDDKESHKDCHAQLCQCDCHGGVPPICDCAEKRQEEERLADLEAETYWKARLLPAYQAKILTAVEGLQGWDFDEFANFFESAKEDSLLKRAEVIQAIREVTL